MADMKVKYAHLFIALTLLATAVWGFWPSYFGPLIRGVVNRHWIIHVHAAVFVGWLILLVTQASLIATGRARTHRRVGHVGIAYGALVLLMGLIISVAMPVIRVHANQLPPDRAGLVVLYNLTDVIVFAGFFISALVLRRRPDFHARLMLSATIALTGAAVGRVMPSGTLQYLLVWLAPLFISMIVDVWVRGRPHPVSWITLPILVTTFFKVDLISPKIGPALMRYFM
jgi:hypothetical protein